MSYSWLRESGNESMPVTQGDLRSLEDYADRLFAKVGVDVEFTRHFLDRVNDSRNEKQINVAELIRIFKQEYKYYGKKIAQLGPDAQAVMKDMRTDVNIPFVLQWDSANNELDLIAKTVMRKKNFKTSNPEFTVEEFSWTDEELDNTQAWQELYGDVVVEATNMFEELGETAELYVDMDGVLADFFGEWAKLMGVNNWKDIKDVDSALNKIKEQPNFWVNLPLTSNALQLLSAIKAYKGRYNILSAPLPGDANSKPQKMAWIKKNLSSFPPQKIILDHNKAKYAKQPDGTPNGLIDDYGKNIASWTAAGGIAIKHEDSNVQHTIDKLDDYIGEAETLKLPNIDVGDEVMVGKFKNRKATVKGFDKDDHNQPVLKTNKGDQKLFKPRISKLMKENNDYSFLRDDVFDAIPRFINKITKPKTYAYAVELLHSILQRKEKEGLHHSLGYYAQSVANTIQGADWRNLMTLYIKHYGDQAVVTEADLNENGIITSQNTTDDVKPGEIQRQAKKLGMSIDSKGSPPLLHKSAAKNSDPNTLSNLGVGNK
jgi:5'(3')-deoxyribonucleotidase|tara:strand:+ start:2122 stop:3750 length:1629 start_codon:yes stop_codon:yes gene_type:complete